MENDEDMEIDPAISASMGFSSFGTQPGKRRKIDSHDNSDDRSVQGAKNPSKGKGVSSSLSGQNTDKNTSRPGDVHGGMQRTGVVATTQGGPPMAVDARSTLR